MRRMEENTHIPFIWDSFCSFKNLQCSFKLCLQNSLLQCPWDTTYIKILKYDVITGLYTLSAMILMSQAIPLLKSPFRPASSPLLKIYQPFLKHAISILLTTQLRGAVNIYSVTNLLHFGLLALETGTAIYSIFQQYYGVLYACAHYMVVWYNS